MSMSWQFFPVFGTMGILFRLISLLDVGDLLPELKTLDANY